MDHNEKEWEEGKKQHIKLSDTAAERYDDNYAETNFATGSYMNYELEVVAKGVDLLEEHRRNLALDLGCGTGRDTFHLHKYFKQVRGYDFSEGMIRVAESHKLSKAAGNVRFIVRDLEVDLLSDLDATSVDYISSSFGMGSFIKATQPFLRDVKRVLKPGGVFIVSFYNSESLVVKIDTLQWAPSLAALLDQNTGKLHVQFLGEDYNFPVSAYSVKQVRRIMQSYFEVVEISTFPTLSSLLPNSIFSSTKARELCTVVDKELSLNEDISGGPYIVAVCKKIGKYGKEDDPIGYENILELLRINAVPQNFKHHPIALSMDELSRILNVDVDDLIKTIVIRVDMTEVGTKQAPKYYAAVLQASRRIDEAKIAHKLKVPRNSIDIANHHEVEEVTGFSIGGIPPFGYPRTINVLMDSRILSKKNVYCGTGKPVESLRVSVENIVRLSNPVIEDISKE